MAEQEAWSCIGTRGQSYRNRERGRWRVLCGRGFEGEENNDKARVWTLRLSLAAEAPVNYEYRIDDFLTRLRRTFAMIHLSAIPSISAISSIAFGGGLELGLASHFRVFTPSTTVALPETRLGIVPGAGGTYRLRSLLGETRAMDLVLTGRRVKGEEAFRIGLCDRLVGPTLEDAKNKGIQDGELRQLVLDGAIDMAKEICEGGPATTKPAMTMTRMGGEAIEANEYEKVLATEDRTEALRAFAEKRKVVFKGM